MGQLCRFRPFGFCGPHDVELYIQLLTLSIPSFFVMDAGFFSARSRLQYRLEPKGRLAAKVDQIQVGRFSSFLNQGLPGMSTDASDQSCKIIR